MDQGGAGIGGAQPGEGAALVRVEEACFAGQVREPDGHDSFQYFGDGFEENYYAERRRCVVRGFAWLVQDHPISMFDAGWVVAKGDKRGEQAKEDGGLYCNGIYYYRYYSLP